MNSIYQNLSNDKQYKASMGLSKSDFEELFRYFEKWYIPKMGNPYVAHKQPVLTDKREAFFSFSLI